MLCYTFILIGQCQLFSQNQRLIDSLQNILQQANSDSARIRFYNQIATEYYLDSAQVISYTSKAIRLSKKNNYAVGLTEAYAILGNFYRIKEDITKGTYFFKEALKTAREINFKKGEAKALYGLGGIAHTQQSYSKALDYLLKAQKIRESINYDKIGLAENYNYLGVIFFEQKNYQSALKYYQKCLQLSLAINYNLYIGKAYNNIGLIYQRLKNYKKAIDYYQRSIPILKKVNSQITLSWVYNGLGEIYQDYKQYLVAEDWINKAIEIRQHLNLKSYLALSFNTLAKNYYLQGKIQPALTNYQKSESICKEIKNLLYYEAALKGLSLCYERLNRPLEALRYFKLYKQAADSLFNNVNTKKLTLLDANYKFNLEKDSLKFLQEKKLLKSQNQLQQAQVTNKLQQRIGGAILVGLGIVLVFAYTIFRSRQRQKKLNHELNKKAKALENKSQELLSLNEELRQSQDQIVEQRDHIEIQNKNLKANKRRIEQSIQSAKNMQQAILPFDEKIQHILPEHFILYRPRDIVSGDFYWIDKLENRTFVAAVDCTGHGIPGAFMSMIGSTLLDHLIKFKKIYNPAKVLEMLNLEVQRVLRQDISNDRSGMDLGLCMLERMNSELVKITYAGAKRPLYYLNINDSQIEMIKGSSKAIGGLQRNDISFANQWVTLPKGSLVYLCTDGYEDQNNAKRKKLGRETLVTLLKNAANLNMVHQKELLETTLKEHMQQEEQRDDILVLGFKI